jgi:hypothetical protein
VLLDLRDVVDDSVGGTSVMWVGIFAAVRSPIDVR